MKSKSYLFISIVLLTALGCSSTPPYSDDKPVLFLPQNVLSEESDAIQTKGMKALLDSFTEYGWEIHNIDKENGIIVAEACRRREHCSEMQASVRKDGSVELIRTPGQTLTPDGNALLQRWIANLKKAYTKRMNN